MERDGKKPHGEAAFGSAASNHPVDFGARLLTGYSHLIVRLINRVIGRRMGDISLRISKTAKATGLSL
jgi:hypothetical protein